VSDIKVSIVIPVYNGANFLHDAIESALAQTYKNIEVMVVNDGSTDGGKTEEVAKSYGGRIKYFYKDNGGVASALNFGIRRMSGEYFSWLSHDDLYHPTKIETQIEFITNTDKSEILYSDYDLVNLKSEVIGRVRMPYVEPRDFRCFITLDNSLHGCTLLIPKRCFEEYGLFDDDLKTTQDYDLWFRLAEKFRFIHVPLTLVLSRQHPEQGSRKLRAVNLEECNNLLIGFLRDLSETEITSYIGKPLSSSYAEIAKNYQQRGFSRARQLAISLALNESSKKSLVDIFSTLGLVSYIVTVRPVLLWMRRAILRVFPKLHFDRP